MRSAFASIAVAFALLGAQVPASAEETALDPAIEAAAAAKIEQAISLYQAQEFVAAGERFHEAFVLCRRPNQLRNAAKAFEAGGRTERALELWREYRTSPGLSAEDGAIADARIRALAEQLFARAAQPGEQPRPPKDEPPAPIAPAAEAPPALVAAAPEPAPATSPLAPVLVAGTGAALVVTALVLFVASGSRLGDLEDKLERRDAQGLIVDITWDEYDSEVSGINTQRGIALTLGSAGLLTAGAGALWWFAFGE